MKKQVVSLLLAATFALAFTGCATSSHSTAWEYKAVIVGTGTVRLESGKDVPSAENVINNMTQQGWQFVATGGGENMMVIFKRHK